METELVPLVAPGQVAAESAAEQPPAAAAAAAVSMGQRLGDGSYVPAPHPNRLGGGTPPGDESAELTHGGAAQLGQPGGKRTRSRAVACDRRPYFERLLVVPAALLGAKEEAEELKKAAEVRICIQCCDPII